MTVCTDYFALCDLIKQELSAKTPTTCNFPEFCPKNVIEIHANRWERATAVRAWHVLESLNQIHPFLVPLTCNCILPSAILGFASVLLSGRKNMFTVCPVVRSMVLC